MSGTRQMILFDDSPVDSSQSTAKASTDGGSTADQTFWDKNVQPSIDQVEENADENWKNVARWCLLSLAETKEEFTADDLVELLENESVKTHNLAALGPIFLKASRAGWIANTGRMERTRISRRHRKITVWKSLIREGTE